MTTSLGAFQAAPYPSEAKQAAFPIPSNLGGVELFNKSLICSKTKMAFSKLMERAHAMGLAYLLGMISLKNPAKQSFQFCDGNWLLQNSERIRSEYPSGSFSYFGVSLKDRIIPITTDAEIQNSPQSSYIAQVLKYFRASSGDLNSFLDLSINGAINIINDRNGCHQNIEEWIEEYTRRLAHLAKVIPTKDAPLLKAKLSVFRALCKGIIGFFSTHSSSVLKATGATTPLPSSLLENWKAIFDATRSSDPDILFQKAMGYRNGSGCLPVDEGMAREFLYKAARAQHAAAAYEYGKTIYKSAAKERALTAYKWIQRAMEKQVIPFLLEDTSMLLEMANHSQEYAQLLYRNAASLASQNDDPVALIFQANLHALCTQIENNAIETFEPIAKAADCDHPEALALMARSYLHGEAVQSDPEAALLYFKAAALYGWAGAFSEQMNMDDFLKMGLNEERCLDLLFAWAREGWGKAIQLLVSQISAPRALYRVGLCIMEGFGGVQPNAFYAFECFLSAFQSSCFEAAVPLARILLEEKSLGSREIRLQILINCMPYAGALGKYALAREYLDAGIEGSPAEQLLKEASNEGYGPASYALWKRTGNHAYLLQAKTEGVSDAAFEFAQLQKAISPSAALDAMVCAVEQKHPKACEVLADWFYEGTMGLQKNNFLALSLYSKAFTLKNTECLPKIAVLQYELNCWPEYVKTLFLACKHLNCASSFKSLLDCNDDPNALFLIGRCYEFGYGTSKDWKKAKTYYEEHVRNAGEKNSATKTLATLELAKTTMTESEKVLHISSESVPYLLAAAAEGNREALFLIGYCHEKGIHLPLSFEKAIFYYKQSAERFYPKAMYELACALEHAAFHSAQPTWLTWLEKAAEKGYPRAQYRLGSLLLNVSDPLAKFRGRAFIHLAIKAGIDEAKSLLPECYFSPNPLADIPVKSQNSLLQEDSHHEITPIDSHEGSMVISKDEIYL